MSDWRRRDEEERVLLAKIRQEDSLALEQLYHHFRPRLHRFLLGLGCRVGDLDELCNETFYVVWCNAKRYDGSCRASTWVFGIARNKALDMLRRQRRQDGVRSDVAVESLAEVRLGDAERAELSDALATALDSLPHEQRLVIELAFFEGLPYEEIAQLAGCPEATVKTRMFHARRKLRNAFPDLANDRRRR